MRYRKIPNISPGQRFASIFWRAYIREGLYWGGLIFGGSFGLKDDLCIPKYSPSGVQSEILLTTFSTYNFRNGHK